VVLDADLNEGGDNAGLLRTSQSGREKIHWLATPRFKVPETYSENFFFKETSRAGEFRGKYYRDCTKRCKKFGELNFTPVLRLTVELNDIYLIHEVHRPTLPDSQNWITVIQPVWWPGLCRVYRHYLGSFAVPSLSLRAKRSNLAVICRLSGESGPDHSGPGFK
jgi:hypothetical protein